MSELVELVRKNLTEAKKVIQELADEMCENTLDINTIDFENVDYQITRISAELSAAYAALGVCVKEEKFAEITLKKTEASIYKKLQEGSETKTTVEQLKRETLLDPNLIPIQKRYGEALCRRITQEGIVKSLDAKKEFLKTLSIRQHHIIKNSNGEY
jgi:septation ring formation regulator EzrA